MSGPHVLEFCRVFYSFSVYAPATRPPLLFDYQFFHFFSPAANRLSAKGLSTHGLSGVSQLPVSLTFGARARWGLAGALSGSGFRGLGFRV